jgi:hypothetical protein
MAGMGKPTCRIFGHSVSRRLVRARSKGKTRGQGFKTVGKVRPTTMRKDLWQEGWLWLLLCF